MRNLLRKPLIWIVFAECAVITTLVIVAWHFLASSPGQDSLAAPVATSPAQVADSAAPVSASVTANTPRRTLPPGLNVDAVFWRWQLAELNRAEAAFETLEWRIVHSAMDAAHRYVESVVLPTIARAERPGR